MSNPRSIAAVTAGIRDLLQARLAADVAGATVTTKPLDEASDDDGGAAAVSRVNLFLYHTVVNPAWRSGAMPMQTRPGESGHPPLALDLHYLITAYADDTIDPNSHHLLGRAMSVLHDHPILDVADLESVFEESDVHLQIERIRITSNPMSLDDLSKLWSALQTDYRLSAAYRVSVILIESEREAATPLPVLRRGAADQGAVVQPSLTPPYPTLEAVEYPDNEIGVVAGETVRLTGHHLDGVALVRFVHATLDLTTEVTPAASPAALDVVLPDPATGWAAGLYAVVGVTSDAETNAVSVAVEPVLDDLTPNPAAAGATTLTALVQPLVHPDQRASLLLGGREILADDFTDPTDTLTFSIPDAEAGEHRVRLRIDGVDSRIIDRTTTQPAFLADTSLVIT